MAKQKPQKPQKPQDTQDTQDTQDGRASAKTRVRILSDYHDGVRAYRCDRSYDVPAEAAAALIAAGIADDNPDAVAAAAAHES